MPRHEAQKSITANLNVKYLETCLLNEAAISRKAKRWQFKTIACHGVGNCDVTGEREDPQDRDRGGPPALQACCSVPRPVPPPSCHSHVMRQDLKWSRSI